MTILQVIKKIYYLNLCTNQVPNVFLTEDQFQLHFYCLHNGGGWVHQRPRQGAERVEGTGELTFALHEAPDLELFSIHKGGLIMAFSLCDQNHYCQLCSRPKQHFRSVHVSVPQQNSYIEIPHKIRMLRGGALGSDEIVKGEPLEWEQCSYKKDPGSCLALLPCEVTGLRRSSMNQESGRHQAGNLPGTLTSGFPASRTGRRKCLLFKP